MTIGGHLLESHLHGKNVSIVYQVREKSNPLKLFVVSSATVWNFSMNFFFIQIYAIILFIVFKDYQMPLGS